MSELSLRAPITAAEEGDSNYFKGKGISKEIKEEIEKEYDEALVPWNQNTEEQGQGGTVKPQVSLQSPGGSPAPGLHPQDDSLAKLHSALRNGYDTVEWILNENNAADLDDGVCAALSGSIFTIDEITNGLFYNAPIYETSHVGCKCRLRVYSETNPELEEYQVDSGGRWA